MPFHAGVYPAWNSHNPETELSRLSRFTFSRPIRSQDGLKLIPACHYPFFRVYSEKYYFPKMVRDIVAN
jgi:hypothetical protein